MNIILLQLEEALTFVATACVAAFCIATPREIGTEILKCISAFHFLSPYLIGLAFIVVHTIRSTSDVCRSVALASIGTGKVDAALRGQ